MFIVLACQLFKLYRNVIDPRSYVYGNTANYRPPQQTYLAGEYL